jgi:hypothetical protein
VRVQNGIKPKPKRKGLSVLGVRAPLHSTAENYDHLAAATGHILDEYLSKSLLWSTQRAFGCGHLTQALDFQEDIAADQGLLAKAKRLRKGEKMSRDEYQAVQRKVG